MLLTLGILLLFPVVQVLIFGFAVRTDDLTVLLRLSADAEGPTGRLQCTGAYRPRVETVLRGGLARLRPRRRGGRAPVEGTDGGAILDGVHAQHRVRIVVLVDP